MPSHSAPEPDARPGARRSPFTLRAAIGRQRVLIGALAALVVIIGIGISGRAPLAGTLLAIELGALALARAVLPTETMGALAVRHRPIDVTVMGVLAVGLAILSTAPDL